MADVRATPTKPGFYWARWLTAAKGTHEALAAYTAAKAARGTA